MVSLIVACAMFMQNLDCKANTHLHCVRLAP